MLFRSVAKNYGFAGRVFVGNLKQFAPDDLKEMKSKIEKLTDADCQNIYSHYNFACLKVISE